MQEDEQRMMKWRLRLSEALWVSSPRNEHVERIVTARIAGLIAQEEHRDYQEVFEALTSTTQAPLLEDSGPDCPACGYGPADGRAPILFAGRRWLCTNCGNDWKKQ